MNNVFHIIKQNLVLLVAILLSYFSAYAIAELREFSIVHSFEETIGGEANPLIEGSDGSLYGTTLNGGGFGGGLVYKVNKDGSGYQVLHSFPDGSFDGRIPKSRVIEGKDGVLYGTTNSGGEFGLGIIYKINKDGSNYSILKNFSESDGGHSPIGALLEASDSKLYGTTSNCSSGRSSCSGFGTIYKINKDGTDFSNLHIFKTEDDLGRSIGARSSASLVEGVDDFLYGTSYSPGGSVFKIQKDGSDFKAIHLFSQGNPLNGYVPAGNIINSNGVIYGATKSGGASGIGGIYRINEDGSDFTLIWSFVNGGDAPSSPTGGLLLTDEETLYGSTMQYIYKVNIDGSGFSVIGERNTTFLSSELIQAGDGEIYGVSNSYLSCNNSIDRPTSGRGDVYSIKDSIETIFNWAELTFPQHFPSMEVTQTLTPWSYRFYPLSGIYLGVNNNDDGVYLLGGVFGTTPIFVDTKLNIFSQALGPNAIVCN